MPSAAVLITPNWSASLRGTRMPATVHAGAGLEVRVDHLRGVHPVDVVGAEDHEMSGCSSWIRFIDW